MVRNIYLVKDLARISGHSTYTIKYYLKIGLIKEFGRSPETNFRYFTDTTIRKLEKIRALRKQQRSIAQIKMILGKKSGTKNELL